MKESRPESAGEILKRLKKTTKLGKVLDQAQIWNRWPEVAGMRLAPHGHPLGFRRDASKTLVIAAESPSWAHRFVFARWALLRRINRLAGHEMVSEIFVVLEGDAPPAEELEQPQDEV